MNVVNGNGVGALTLHSCCNCRHHSRYIQRPFNRNNRAHHQGGEAQRQGR